MNGKIGIQSAFDLGYTCVYKDMVYVSISPEARMNIIILYIITKLGESVFLKNLMHFLAVFSGKCVKLSLRLNKFFIYYSHVNSVEFSQFITIEPYSERVLILIAIDEEKHLFRRETSFWIHKNVLDAGSYTYHKSSSLDDSNHPLMLNNPNHHYQRGIFWLYCS